MKADDIGAAEQFRKGERLDPAFPAVSRVDLGIAGGERHAEPGAALRQPLADGAQPDDAHRPPAQLYPCGPDPAAGFGGVVQGRQLPGGGEDEPHGQLGHALGVDARGVGDGDAQTAGGSDVHRVAPRAVAGDHLQIRAALQHVGGDLVQAGDVPLTAAQQREQFLRREGPSGGVKDDFIGKGAQAFHGRRGGAAGHGGGGDQDFHARFAPLTSSTASLVRVCMRAKSPARISSGFTIQLPPQAITLSKER